MLREKIEIYITEDDEAGVVDVSIAALGVQLWLACFDSRELANEFIKVMFDKLRENAKFITEYEVHNENTEVLL